ncbi:hypothetical protein EsH8_I_001410 [Colletotrichum jinshuiense]
MMRSQLQSVGRLAKPSTAATPRLASAAQCHITNAASKATTTRSLATATRSASRTIPRAAYPALASSQYRSFSTTRIQHGEVIITVPQMAESITEGTIASIGKQVGDRVEADEEVASIETDKIDVAVNAPEEGTIVELFVAEGDTVEVGQKLARMETGAAPEGEAKKESKPEPAAESKPAESESKPEPAAPAPAQEQKKAPEAPKQQESKPAAAPKPAQQQKPADAPQVPFGATGLFSRGERTEKLTRMRKTIATKLKQSQNMTASLTTINEVDMSALMAWRAKNKEDVMKRHGVRLGYMGAFTKATCLAAQQVPQLNASIDTDKEVITYRDYVDISIAVSAPKGLITPVLRNVDSLDIIGIERGVAELAAKARDSKLSMADLEGGNFSISNPGIFGSLFGTPVINYPQAAVFNMNGIKERPVVVDGKLEIRPMMYITVTYDHRLIDGREAGGAANYVDEMYLAWKANPENVHVSWHTYFRNMEDPSVHSTQAFQPPPGLISSRHTTLTQTTPNVESSDAVYYLKAQNVVRAFQEHGHTRADINPLGKVGNDTVKPHASLPSTANLSKYGFTPADLDREIPLGPELLPHLSQENKTMKLRDIIAACEQIYCGSFGVEYLHISDPVKRDWIRERVEAYHTSSVSAEEKRRILDTLIWATSLERFLAAKFPNEKRFGLDGAEGLAPGLAALIDRCAEAHGVQDIVIGSCHRGRMNLMSTVYGKDFETLFRQFAGAEKFDADNGQTGDVKYHFGMDGSRTTAGGKTVGVSMLPNPSHLEAVDPVAQGKAKAVQHAKNDVDQSKVMFMALHGDAAFSGQGPVYETLNLSGLKGYEVGGTVRLMVNNQIGFTTDSPDSRSTPYCTDLAKFIEAPVFHVNADDPEAVVFLAKLAADWRAEFRSDIVIDVNCYRRFGHNEIDQASFTQPEMYKKIDQQKPLMDKYIEKLVAEETMSAEVIAQQKAWVWEELEQKLARSKLPVEGGEGAAQPESAVAEDSSPATGVDESKLATVAQAITSVPDGFTLHRNLQRILAAKKQAFDAGSVDWSTAEALAFGSLLLEGKPVRISGQDVERGTFSQRHSVLHDQVTHAEHTPLNHLDDGGAAQAAYAAVNSPLSEFGVLGFDYGYSLAAPGALVMWEAQFGDFANNAQVVLDQFIASGEAKWLLRSGLVVSLPHGYDGQGPEHSSARLGRFLELCSEDPRAWPADLARAREAGNMRVVYMTTPANLFHALRRQVHSPHKKPLIIFFSKSLLRHPLARSSVQELSGESSFQPVLPDPEHGGSIVPREEISRVILCSGQVYASLHKYREAKGIKDVAITRIEELHPFPWAEVKQNLDSYPAAKTVVWCQEEPYNGGAWQYMRDRLETVAAESENHRTSRIVYAGRGAGAAAATGSKKTHQKEEEALLETAFGV